MKDDHFSQGLKVHIKTVEALGRKGDVLLGFSTSGSPDNVVLALEPGALLDLWDNG